MKVTTTIAIDREVYAALRELSRDFRDTPNRVLRRVLKLDPSDALHEYMHAADGPRSIQRSDLRALGMDNEGREA